MTNKMMLVLALAFIIFPIIQGCCSLVAEDIVNTHFRRQSEEQIYRKELGIGNTDAEVETFLTKELSGLSHSETLNKLSQWGEVEEAGECSLDRGLGRCVVYLRDFLGTEKTYELTLFFVDAKVDSVAIYYS